LNREIPTGIGRNLCIGLNLNNYFVGQARQRNRLACNRGRGPCSHVLTARKRVRLEFDLRANALLGHRHTQRRRDKIEEQCRIDERGLANSQLGRRDARRCGKLTNHSRRCSIRNLEGGLDVVNSEHSRLLVCVTKGKRRNRKRHDRRYLDEQRLAHSHARAIRSRRWNSIHVRLRCAIVGLRARARQDIARRIAKLYCKGRVANARFACGITKCRLRIIDLVIGRRRLAEDVEESGTCTGLASLWTVNESKQRIKDL
jgi:hypothetical protein